ncbi:hypothetical protein [Ammoniphilus resinae]|uniref:Uncharacterized protein n=1 Tax=Ammoniphilus resinae TaxID=861532 RepID=A0ABS4GVG5_9BACL|nr:hypothetical protein [Ammoniphilus resinae]MBP1934264.1 hypothetical protein [Ammoniphilus resinae]
MGIRHNLNCDTDSVSACGLSVDGSTHQLLKTDNNRVLATLPSASTHSQIGQLFSTVINVNTNFNEVSQILFSNTSSKTMYLDKIMCSSVVVPENTPRNYVSSVIVTIIKNVTIEALGTPLSATNLNTAFPDTASVTVTQNPNALSGTVIFGIRPLGEYASIDFDGRMIVPPNSNIIVQLLFSLPIVVNVDFWATITWYEL